MRRILAALLCAGLLAAVAAAQVPDDARAAIEAYRAALTAAEAGRGKIEPAFALVDPIRDALLRGTVLQSLTNDAYELVVRQLRGVIINRRGPEFLQPDLTYFTQLAATRGDAADKAFFAALRSTYPDSVFPVYQQRLPDGAGCTRFGSSSLVETYRLWTQFTRQFPARYTAPAADQIESVFELLTDGTCACGNTAEVIRELMEFNTRFPASAIRTELDTRLRFLRGGQAGIRESCKVG